MRICEVHAEDYRRSAGGFDSLAYLLVSDVDFPAVAVALEKIGYDDYITSEIMLSYQHLLNQLLTNTSASMNQIFVWSGKETVQ